MNAILAQLLLRSVTYKANSKPIEDASNEPFYKSQTFLLIIIIVFFALFAYLLIHGNGKEKK